MKLVLIDMKQIALTFNRRSILWITRKIWCNSSKYQALLCLLRSLLSAREMQEKYTMTTHRCILWCNCICASRRADKACQDNFFDRRVRLNLMCLCHWVLSHDPHTPLEELRLKKRSSLVHCYPAYINKSLIPYLLTKFLLYEIWINMKYE